MAASPAPSASTPPVSPGPLPTGPTPGAASPPWQLRLLGGFELSGGSQRLTRLQSRPVMALLARLALQPDRVHAREELIDHLWPDVGLDIGRNRLRQALSTLRSTLEPAGATPVLQADRRTVCLIAGALDCDVLRFERLAQAGQPARAMALYRGELLPGFYDDWIQHERIRLAARVDILANTLADTLARQPVPQRRHALPRYLTRLLGCEAIGARLRADLASHRLVTLIGPGGSGKTRLAVELAQAALEGAAWGLGGPAQPQGFDWVEFVPLVHCAAHNGREAMVDALLLALGLAPQVGGGPNAQAHGPAAVPVDAPVDSLIEALIEALMDALSGRRALIVLDNFEQLVEPCAGLVATLVSRLPQVHWLITSRRALGLDGERQCAMPALALPSPQARAADLPRNPAVSLFIDRARAVRHDYQPDARQLADIGALVTALDGLPLAIELAASRVRSLSPAQILGLVQARGGFPVAPIASLALLQRTGPRAGDDLRHASMLSVLDWSWALLRPPARRLLAAVSVFAGEFSAEAAVAVASAAGSAQVSSDASAEASAAASAEAAAPGAAHRAQATVLMTLDDLVTHSLLCPARAPGHFTVSGLVREYASQQWSPADALALRARHRQWVIGWAQALPTSPPLREVRHALPEVALALTSADADAAPADAARLFDALQNALSDITLPPGARAALVRCVAALAPSPQRSVTQASLARALYRAGDARQARHLADAALAGLAGPVADPQALAPLRAHVLARIAHLRWRLDRDPAVAAWLVEALQIARQARLHGLQASVLSVQGAMARPTDPARAAALQRQAIAAWQAAGDAHGVNTGRHNLALALAARPDTRESALTELAAMLADARAAEDWAQVGFGANQLGEVLRSLRRWADAASAYREGIAVGHEALEVLPLAYGLWNLPAALAHLRRPQAAARLMGFAAAFWQRRFGPLSGADERELRRVQRLVRAQAGAGSDSAAWLAQGAGLTLAEAVALALDPAA